MVFDIELGRRVRAALDEINPFGLEEKKMFGGVCYLLRGNMACGVYKDGLIVRVGEAAHAAAMARPGAGPFDITGKAMKGWVYVKRAGFPDDDSLQEWVRLGVNFAAGLPAK